MRYIQMIKRCKLPLKKATSDVEAHSEEHAKRCKLSTPEFKPPALSVEERLGHLKNSAVARLLVEGRLPAETISSPKPSLVNDTAMDLSKTSMLGNVRTSYQHDTLLTSAEDAEMIDTTAENLRMQMGAEMEGLKKRGSSNEVRFAGWKCRYCPFTAHSAKKLYSHYQFHQQLLTSHSSKPHLEWLSAYRQSKEFAEGNPPTSTQVTSSHIASTCDNESSFVFPAKEASPSSFNLLNFPKGTSDAENLQSLRSSGLSLRYLLGNSRSYNQSESSENSASGCLRSIVQEVMKKDSSSPSSSVSPMSPYPKTVNMDSSEYPSFAVGKALNALNQEVIETGDHRADQGRMESGIDGRKHVSETHNGQYPGWEGPVHESGRDMVCKENAGLVHSVVEPSQIRRCIRVERVEQVLQRPLSRESTSSYTSSTSEEINVTDIPPQHNRLRLDSNVSETSQSTQVRLVSRKRSHSVESERSSLSSPTGHPSSLPACQENFPNQVSHHDSNAIIFSSYKSPRLECNQVKREVMDTRQNSSPVAVISSTGTPPPMQWSSNGMASPTQKSVQEPGHFGPPHLRHESSVQCELLVPPPTTQWSVNSPDMMSHPGEIMDYQYSGSKYQSSGSVTGCMKCPHCGISFEDSVLHSIHMGCHSHSDPFICNVCGEHCCNKYGFYTHIMRGHHT